MAGRATTSSGVTAATTRRWSAGRRHAAGDTGNNQLKGGSGNDVIGVASRFDHVDAAGGDDITIRPGLSLSVECEPGTAYAATATPSTPFDPPSPANRKVGKFPSSRRKWGIRVVLDSEAIENAAPRMRSA